MTAQASRYRVEKMDCPTEEKLIRGALERLPEVSRLDVDLMGKEVVVHHTFADDGVVFRKLVDIGMDPQRIDAEAGASAPAPERAPTGLLARHGWLIGSGLFAFAAEALAWTSGDERSLPVIGLSLGSVAMGGRETVIKGIRAVRSFTLNINFLMMIAIAGAAVIGQWPEAAMVTFLFALAEAVEAYSLDRARDAIRSLLSLAPPVATVRRGKSFVEVAVNEVKAGDEIRVRAGESIPLDGEVLTGHSAVNQAPITGESMPVEKQPGSKVFAGTLNGEGMLTVRATSTAGESTIARIARSIQAAQSQRAPTQRFVDRFARYYTPAVVVVAVLVAAIPPVLFNGDVGDWVYKALVLLVIACPCALVISTPVTVVSGLGAAAKAGILIKGGIYLEEARRLRAIAVDKTGTITEGKPALTDVDSLGDRSELEVLRLAASLEAGSDHPVARAVTDGGAARAGEPAISLLEVAKFGSITGRGIEGTIEGRRYILGSHRLAEERGVCSAAVERLLETFEADGKTAMVLADETRALGVLAVADTVRASSKRAVADLKAADIEVVMLTGDNARTAAAVAKEVGIEVVRAELLPEDKVEAVDELVKRRGHVAMIGDGVNDAPALARSSIGIAMGAAGTDTALETADVALMQDDLRKVSDLVRLSRLTAAVLMQNITLAIGTKVVFFALALAGSATLWMAVFADLGASLIVVANGLRLLRSLPKSTNSH